MGCVRQWRDLEGWHYIRLTSTVNLKGRQGSNSIAARFCEKQHGWDGDGPKTDFKINENNPYAEMWFGTYPALPTYVASTGEDLQTVIDRNPQELIGKQVMDKFGHSKLPYLPKVLSIAKALPLQLHPNKELATKLHNEKPDAFTDPNHKPEIAVALSEFEAFCGFRPLKSIAEIMQLEPLKQFLPKNADTSDMTNDTLREVVRNMLQASDETVKKVYKTLVSVSPEQYKGASYIPKLAPRLADQYSEADPGVLVALVTMNYLVLQAGESIYIPADGIHAYLSGDIIECMARSNNVLNVGFCPRAERSNIDMFCSCLTFSPHGAEECMLRPTAYGKSKNGKTKVFSPPLSEFDMLETKLGNGESEVLGAVGGPSTLVVSKGSATMKTGGKSHDLHEGSVFFVAHDVEIELQAGQAGLEMYTAIVD